MAMLDLDGIAEQVQSLKILATILLDAVKHPCEHHGVDFFICTNCTAVYCKQCHGHGCQCENDE